MIARENLTSEKIKKYFKNNFELANYAIQIIRHMVRSGKEIHLDQFLDEVARNPNKYHLDEFKVNPTKQELRDLLNDEKK
ncbi:MAG: hypothetical protein HKM07_07050 [Chlamydiae bacterium]|nr:hypothetical protein [Chlamydiota bacterium]